MDKEKMYDFGDESEFLGMTAAPIKKGKINLQAAAYLAAHAPKEIPEWWKGRGLKIQEPELPKIPVMLLSNDALYRIVENWRRFGEGGLMEEVRALHKVGRATSDEVKIAEEYEAETARMIHGAARLREYKEEKEYFEWREYFARRMLALLEAKR